MPRCPPPAAAGGWATGAFPALRALTGKQPSAPASARPEGGRGRSMPVLHIRWWMLAIDPVAN